MSLGFKPALAGQWSKKTVDFLEGPTESIRWCSKEFDEQIAKLVQPNIWTGDAAKNNYENFVNTHNALIDFTNRFGAAYEEAMNKVASTFQKLENVNLGKESDIMSSFGELSFTKLSEMVTENINIEDTKYNYTVIADISDSLEKINNTFVSVCDKLKTHIQELAAGDFWEGVAAEDACKTLTDVVTTNYDEVSAALDKCIRNIAEAAENARRADLGM